MTYSLNRMARVLLLLPTTTYRTKAFVEAALKLGVDIVAASERPSTLQRKNPSGLLTLDFSDPVAAATRAIDFARERPVDAVIPVDEDTAVAAATIARALNIRHNSPESVMAAKNKHLMRTILNRGGVRVPQFWHTTLDQDPSEIATRITYPVVVKPVFLSTSRGVIRANDQREFAAALKRLESILSRADIASRGGSLARDVLIEEFIPGTEVALEGLLSDGELQVLALFDKPDPLDGPFFEETIYVTPSRLPDEIQTEIASTTLAATRAMGLERGPIHAELRINNQGAWVIEVAARAIGGLCARALRFGNGVALEELIIRHSLGEDVSDRGRETEASGVMMVPIPHSGVLRKVRGLERARTVAFIDDVIISAHLGQKLLPPPEGATYLGFIFAKAETPDLVEQAIREAHGYLEFVID